MSNHSLNMNLPSLNLSSALLLNKTSSTTRIQYYLHCLFNQCFNYLPSLSIYYYISTTNIRFIIGHIFHCYASLTLKMIPKVFCMEVNTCNIINTISKYMCNFHFYKCKTQQVFFFIDNATCTVIVHKWFLLHMKATSLV